MKWEEYILSGTGRPMRLDERLTEQNFGKYESTARVVESYFCSMTNKEYAAFGVKNCAVLTYEWDD